MYGYTIHKSTQIKNMLEYFKSNFENKIIIETTLRPQQNSTLIHEVMYKYVTVLIQCTDCVTTNHKFKFT